MSVARLSSVAAPAFDARALRARLAALATVLEAAAERVRGGDDPEAIHDLRVAARRLAATLALWQGGLDPDRSRAARRSLRRLRRRLSRSREREVLALQLAELIVGEPPGVRQAGALALERIARRAARGRRNAARLVKRARIARTLRRITDCPRSPVPEPGTLLSAARERADARRTEALRETALALATGDDERLHQARIAVKRWRYAVEGLDAIARDPRAAVLKALRDLQRCLGDVHDAAVLRDALARRASRQGRRGRVARAEALAWLREKAAETRRRALERLPVVAAAAGVAAAD
jgi:CHAD domain-containing protein